MPLMNHTPSKYNQDYHQTNNVQAKETFSFTNKITEFPQFNPWRSNRENNSNIEHHSIQQ